MSENTVDPLTFDLSSALSGAIEYATDTVDVVLNEKLMYEYAKVTEAADADPGNEAKQLIRETMFNELRGLFYTFTVQSVPRDALAAVEDQIEEEFKPAVNAFGGKILSREAEEELELRKWSLFLTSVTRQSDGAVSGVDFESVRQLRNTAPRVALGVIKKAIDDLTNRSVSGYQQIVQDPGFLSQPSPTE